MSGESSNERERNEGGQETFRSVRVVVVLSVRQTSGDENREEDAMR